MKILKILISFFNLKKSNEFSKEKTEVIKDPKINDPIFTIKNIPKKYKKIFEQELKSYLFPCKAENYYDNNSLKIQTLKEYLKKEYNINSEILHPTKRNFTNIKFDFDLYYYLKIDEKNLEKFNENNIVFKEKNNYIVKIGKNSILFKEKSVNQNINEIQIHNSGMNGNYIGVCSRISFEFQLKYLVFNNPSIINNIYKYKEFLELIQYYFKKDIVNFKEIVHDLKYIDKSKDNTFFINPRETLKKDIKNMYDIIENVILFHETTNKNLCKYNNNETALLKKKHKLLDEIIYKLITDELFEKKSTLENMVAFETHLLYELVEIFNKRYEEFLLPYEVGKPFFGVPNSIKIFKLPLKEYGINKNPYFYFSLDKLIMTTNKYETIQELEEIRAEHAENKIFFKNESKERIEMFIKSLIKNDPKKVIAITEIEHQITEYEITKVENNEIFKDSYLENYKI
jgi:hypothetical protein